MASAAIEARSKAVAVVADAGVVLPVKEVDEIAVSWDSYSALFAEGRRLVGKGRRSVFRYDRDGSDLCGRVRCLVVVSNPL